MDENRRARSETGPSGGWLFSKQVNIELEVLPNKDLLSTHACPGGLIRLLVTHDQRITPSSRPTWPNTASPVSRSSWLWAAEIMTRMRAMPRGTVGKVMAVPKTPSS